MFGAGIWIWESGLKTLEMLGAFEQATARARVIREWRVADRQGNTLAVRKTTPKDRMYLPPRADMYQALIDQAEKSGVEIRTSSPVSSVHPDGLLTLESGEERHADLVVVADGAFSRLRECILATAWIDMGTEWGVRMLIDHQPQDPIDVCTEYWNGAYRLLYNPCTEGKNYVFVGGPISDDRTRNLAVDLGFWKEKFPAVCNIIDRFVQDSRWDRIVNVRCRRWTAGRVAIIGDAAHGMPPNLGQAANTAFINAMALAQMATSSSDIPVTLTEWEARQRPISDHVQWFSYIYGLIVARWPASQLLLRDDAIRFVTQTEWFDESLNRGARYVPAGWQEWNASREKSSVVPNH